MVEFQPKFLFFENQYLQKLSIYRFEILIIKNVYIDSYDVQISVFYLFQFQSYRLPKSVMAGPVRETGSSIYMWIKTLASLARNQEFLCRFILCENFNPLAFLVLKLQASEKRHGRAGPVRETGQGLLRFARSLRAHASFSVSIWQIQKTA